LNSKQKIFSKILILPLTAILVHTTVDQYLSKSKKSNDKKVTQVFEAKSNFCKKNFFSLAANISSTTIACR